MGNKIKSSMAWVVIVGAMASLYLSVVGLPPGMDARPHEALGQAVADEALKLAGGGGRIYLIARDSAAFESPATDAQLKAFHRALKKSGGQIVSTNLLKLDPLRLSGVPAADYFQVLKKASESDVIVSFIGPPVLLPDQLARLTDKKPRVVAVCAGEMPAQVNLRRIFDQKLLHTAILSRKGVSSSSPATDNPQAWFEHLFSIITPANLAELPAPSPRPQP